MVFNGNGNSVSVNGLVPGTTYWVRVYEANCDGNKTVYNSSASSGNPASQKTITALPYFQSLVVSELNDFGVSKVWVPVYTNNNVYGSNPPIILNATGNKSTRFSIQSSNASRVSIYLTNKAGRIVTGKNISYNPDRYGTFDPFSYPSHDRFDVEFTNPSILEEQPYTSLRLHILFDDGLTGLTIPVQIYKTEAIPLPVVYKDISAKWQKAEKRILLDWSTASESNNDFFEIERSFESQDFQKIAKLTGAMYSTNQNNYLYYDYDIGRTGHYTYRILQTDLDGNSAYSWPVSASVSGHKSIKTSLYPNPASGLINLNIEAYEGADLKVEIFNGLGQMITTDLSNMIMTESSLTYPIDGDKLMQGLYSVIISIDGLRYTHKLIVLR